MKNLHDYFLTVAQVWEHYFAGNISMSVRDRQLANLRAQLHKLPPSGLHGGWSR